VTWLGERCPECGIADVLLDGEKLDSVDLYSAEKIVAEVMNVNDLNSGPHRLQIKVSERKNALSTGHRVTIDAIDASAQ